MTISEMIALLEAAKGKKMQRRLYVAGSVCGKWEAFDALDSYNWDFATYQFRVAPEPREFWVPEPSVPKWNGRDCGFDIRHAKSSELCAAYWPAGKPVLFREVME